MLLQMGNAGGAVSLALGMVCTIMVFANSIFRW